MQTIHGILFEPVGCLAEFSPEPFNEMATLVSGRRSKASRSASRTYWDLLNLMETTGMRLSESQIAQIGHLELQAVETASVYEDVVPEHGMFITDTADGLQVANSLGLNSILMMNDPDEAMRLAVHGPSGGIVSLHELPDFIRLVAAENARSR